MSSSRSAYRSQRTAYSALRETSALVTVLSEQWGKVNFVAKGIRAKTRQNRVVAIVPAITGAGVWSA